MSDVQRNRVRLWLRSERAFGLSSVAACASPIAACNDAAEVDADVLDAPAEAPQAPVDTPAARVRVDAPRSAAPPPVVNAPIAAAAAAGTAALFGGAATDVADEGLLLPSPAMPPFAAPPLPPDEKRARLLAMDDKEVRGCTKCRLCETRKHTVFGEGDPDASIFFIGEGPGENEDLTGRPFVGRAGELLDKMIRAMGLRREQVMIANIVKCRPPGNREPAPDEVATCTPYLLRQLEIVRPRVIVTLGRPASQYMLQSKLSMSRLRGQWHDWRGIRLMPTYHPAYVLRNYADQTRAAVWSDLQLVMDEVGLPRKKGGGG